MPKPKRPSRTKVAALSHKLQDLLLEAQKREKAPKGMQKCPRCGIAVQPTKTGRIRVHDDPLAGSRCAASKRILVEATKKGSRKTRTKQ